MAVQQIRAGIHVCRWHREAVVLNLDDATTTSIKELAYRKQIKISIRDPTTKRIDRLTPHVFNFHSDNDGFEFQIGIAVK